MSITLDNQDLQKVIEVAKNNFSVALVDEADIVMAGNTDEDLYNWEDMTRLGDNIYVSDNGKGGTSVMFTVDQFNFVFNTKRSKCRMGGVSLDKTTLGAVFKKHGPTAVRRLVAESAQHEMLVDTKALASAGTLLNNDFDGASWYDMTDANLISDLAYRLGLIEANKMPVPDKLGISHGAPINRLRTIQKGAMTIGSSTVTFTHNANWNVVSEILKPENVVIIDDPYYTAVGENQSESNYLGNDVILFSSKTHPNTSYQLRIVAQKAEVLPQGDGFDMFFVMEQRSCGLMQRWQSAYYCQNAMKPA
jgi:hypothetical protein